MNRKLMACVMGIGSMVPIGCAGSSGVNSGTSEQAVPTVEATGTEESLREAVNAARRKAGKTELPVSSILVRLARAESAAAAASGQLPADNSESVRMRSGLHSVGKLQGVLKDRGTHTGAGFVEYWAKGDSGMLLDEWSNMGVGISKSPDGRLFAVVLMGGEGGRVMLMEPALNPGGYRRR